MLRLDRLTLARGATRLLEGTSLAVHAGQKIGTDARYAAVRMPSVLGPTVSGREGF